MWTRPTLPSSSWRKAPYGVMRWTVPSTTAPTSMSAMSTPFVHRDRGPGLQGGHYPIRPPEPSMASIPRAGFCSCCCRLAVALGELAALRDGDEGDLSRLDHAETFPGDPLELLGI